jgi:glutaredoxin
MEIVVYLHDSKYMESTLKTLELLKTCKIPFTFKTFRSDDMIEISEALGEKIRRYPQVIVDGERVGGYYDLVEFLMNKNIINFAGEPQWKNN